ncbi:MAG: dipeptidase [Kordiimonadaceae bacterium]|nr:dipeptidase [Kordiimonadaceae bacterium]
MKNLFVSVSLLALAACGEQATQETTAERDYAADAARLAQSTLIVDTHIDVPYRLGEGWVDVSISAPGGDFDHPRAVAGGLNAPFMSIYTPAIFDGTPKSKEHAESMIALVERMVTEAPEKFVVTKTTAEVEAAFAAGKIALPLGMENGAPVSGDLANLDYFFERGIRYITLTHSKANHISDSSYDKNRKWNGLSDFGKTVVKRMNKLGIMVDISHVSDEAFWQAIKISATPIIASHSSARHFTPGFERNMSDDMIKALAKNGGVIMINYGSGFLTEAANQYLGDRTSAYAAYLKEEGIEETIAIKKAFRTTFLESHPYPYADISDVLDHIDHVVKIAGIDAIGIGSDYDGVGDSLPTGLKDVSSFTGLVEGLLKRGYSDADVIKIMSGNIMRVWKQVEAYASEHG